MGRRSIRLLGIRLSFSRNSTERRCLTRDVVAAMSLPNPCVCWGGVPGLRGGVLICDDTSREVSDDERDEGDVADEEDIECLRNLSSRLISASINSSLLRVLRKRKGLEAMMFEYWSSLG